MPSGESASESKNFGAFLHQCKEIRLVDHSKTCCLSWIIWGNLTCHMRYPEISKNRLPPVKPLLQSPRVSLHKSRYNGNVRFVQRTSILVKIFSGTSNLPLAKSI